jgi:uncharacterized membrane protein
MQDFDSLKNLWHQPGATELKTQLPVTMSNTSATTKMKLQKPHLHGTIALTLTGIFIACLGLFGHLNFTHWYTYAGMALISVTCFIQASVMYITYKKIKSIDDTAAPVAHLKQWEAYYDLRKKQNKWNIPVYYIALNIAMAVYMVEIFTGRPVLNVTIFTAVYIAWMLFAYFYLGKRNIKRENNRLQKIIDELKAIEGQLNQSETG